MTANPWRGEAVGDGADVVVDAENLLHDDKAARGVVRPGAPGAEPVAVGGGQCDGGAHACRSLASCCAGTQHGAMAEIVNLRRVKKQQARDAAAQAAAENRARHGRTGAAKAADRLERERATRAHEGNRTDSTPLQP